MYQIIFIYIMLTNDPYEYVLFLDVIVHILYMYAEKPNKFKIQIRQPPAFQYELYTALCLYLCLPLTRCINSCCLLYLVFSVFHLYLILIVILQNAESK